MDEGGDRWEPLVRVKIYVEGGGDSKALRALCRRGFSEFIKKAGLRGRMPSIVACGPRGTAYDDFKTAHAHEDGIAVLLVDAEGPVKSSTGAWQHLQESDGWKRPDRAGDDQCHLMVQIMESWFLADVDTLERFYGQTFRQGALPQNPNIEKVSKQDIERGLEQAMRGTNKGSYDKNKSKHGFEILAVLDPEKVMEASPYANRLIETLTRLAEK